MSDYISRQAAIALLKKWADGYSYIETPTDDAIDEFNAIPAADVRPVVFCKECIHLGFKDFSGICNGPMCGIVKPWDYCSHGVMGGVKRGTD